MDNEISKNIMDKLFDIIRTELEHTTYLTPKDEVIKHINDSIEASDILNSSQLPLIKCVTDIIFEKDNIRVVVGVDDEDYIGVDHIEVRICIKEDSKSYEVPKCPAFSLDGDGWGENFIGANNLCNVASKGKPVKCINHEECVIKKIVDACRKAHKVYDNEEFYEDDCDRFCGESIMAERILDILEVSYD